MWKKSMAPMAIVLMTLFSVTAWNAADQTENTVGPQGLSTHVLDTATGKPAAKVGVVLHRQQGEGWVEVSKGETDTQGRVRDLQPGGRGLPAGTYRLVFETGAYFKSAGVATFFPRVEIIFTTTNAGEHYHIPLLLSPFGYSTYRGS